MTKEYCPLVSIVIPTFNRESLIGETLNSVLNQTYNQWECIVVDDGSTDNTVNVVSEYVVKDNRYKFIKRNIEPKGANTCRNIGLDKSKGEFIIFLDSDDLLLITCLGSRLTYTIKNLDFYVFPVSIEENPQQPKFENIWLDRENIFDNDLTSFLLWSQWQTMSVLWKKEAIVKLSGFNTELKSSQDGFLHRDALIEGMRYEVFREVKPDALYRKNLNSITSTISSDKIYSRFLSFKWNFFKMNNYGLLNEIRKELILGQFLYCLKQLKKYPNESKKNEITDFIINQRFLDKTVLILLDKTLLRIYHPFINRLIKRVFRLIIPKYSLWKL